MEPLKGADQTKWFSMKVKVALAVAIIKSKPQGMSGRQYAEALACKLKSQDESWKKKAQDLQQEVLRLRQEVLLTRLTSNPKSGMEPAGQSNKLDDVSHHLFGSESVVQRSALQQDCDSEIPDLMLEDPPLPPAPSCLFAGPQGTAQLPHVHFLQSLCALNRVEGNSRGLEASWFSPDGEAGSLLVDSVCQLLDSVVTACRDPPSLGDPPRDLVLQACQVAAQAMDLFCSQRLPFVDFVRHVEESLRELTAMLLHSNQLSRGQDSSVLDKFPLDQYHNSCYLFWILEELLQKSKVLCREEVGSEQVGFLSHLEQRVFLLSDEFPLFSICMWRIGSLLTSSENEIDSSASVQAGRV
ncbi:Meiosis-specific protein MEI4 [Channa argus]|uniref:Meiosis-specific protein MEI4 n=1 Tax=Channa argus TaxID=215402 RepID=A0A6G1QLV2_CHAAH|nr:Meiosis-specific protein MEI4 [Channa argus]